MKANRKFLHGDDEAVSPVIAVILMVAITVVLAATVYVWVSGFGSSSNSSPAHTMSLVSAGAITGADDTGDTTNDYWYKTYTVSSADPSLTYGDIKVTVGGTEHTFATTAGLCGTGADALDAATASAWLACGGTSERLATSTVTAGDKFILICHLATNCLADKDFLILDTEANSVMVTLKVR